MISEGFKKQLIIDQYKTQLLPVMENKVDRISIITNKRMKNILLFKRDDDRLLNYIYQYKYNTIEEDIRWFLHYLTNLIYTIYLIYKYNNDEKTSVQELILYTLEYKQNIENSHDYAEYIEDIYD
jgi:hypothetical protein